MTPAAIYTFRMAQARQLIAELSAALDADNARVAERMRAAGADVNYADAGRIGHAVEKLGELVRFLTA